MNLDHANCIPMAEILNKLQIQPNQVQQNKLLYRSPLHMEEAALLEVNLKTNRWFDHSRGIGGGPVDFVCAYLKHCHEAHTELDALRWLNNMVVPSFETVSLGTNPSVNTQPDTELILKTKKPVQHLGLVHYLEKQGIPLAIAHRFLKEVRVYNIRTKNNLITLGFPNEGGGLELRNPFFQGCLGPQAITFIRGRMPKSTCIHLFNDVIDYLSAISQLNGKGFKGDTIVLNSLSCLPQIIPYIQNYGYRNLYSWMDHDEAGEKAQTVIAEFCQTQIDLRHTPMNKVYAPHKDVNAWHMHTLDLSW